MPIPDRFLEDPNDRSGIHDLTPAEAADLMDQGRDELCVLDVRTLREHELHRIPGAELLPIQELAMNVHTLDPERPTLVYCEHGIRSLQAAAFLKQLGFSHVFNLRGGISQWRGAKEGNPPG